MLRLRYVNVIKNPEGKPHGGTETQRRSLVTNY